jgi:hypothetical protein
MEHERGAFKVNRSIGFDAVKKMNVRADFGLESAPSTRCSAKIICAANLDSLTYLLMD